MTTAVRKIFCEDFAVTDSVFVDSVKHLIIVDDSDRFHTHTKSVSDNNGKWVPVSAAVRLHNVTAGRLTQLHHCDQIQRGDIAQLHLKA
jgi:hypothetical protein